MCWPAQGRGDLSSQQFDDPIVFRIDDKDLLAVAEELLAVQSRHGLFKFVGDGLQGKLCRRNHTAYFELDGTPYGRCTRNGNSACRWRAGSRQRRSDYRAHCSAASTRTCALIASFFPAALIRLGLKDFSAIW